MVRQFGKGGCDGYVYMGRGELYYRISAVSLIPVAASYRRNFYRVLDLLETFYEIPLTKQQTLLGTILIVTMTAYECLTDDLLAAMQGAGLVAQQTRKDKATLQGRRDHLFQSMHLAPGSSSLALDCLYAFRNCLAHNAGIADEGFIRKLEQAKQQPSGYQAGEPLILDASMAVSFADSLQHSAHVLLLKAQELLHAPKSKNC